MVGGFILGDKFFLEIYSGLKSLTYFLKSLEIWKTNIEIFIPIRVFDSNGDLGSFNMFIYVHHSYRFNIES